MDSAPDSPRQPSRRALLRGATLFGVAAATTAATARTSWATGQPSTSNATEVDYPGAIWAPASTSNYTVSNRPSTYPIDYVVIHVTQETFNDTIAIFQDPNRKVSSHYVVRSADGQIAQCVRNKDVGWHAGNWNYNTWSIGIEHEGWVDQPAWFTQAMYSSSAALTRTICNTYGIPKTRQYIIGHNEVPGATHTDPGQYWDWAYYMQLVNAQ